MLNDKGIRELAYVVKIDAIEPITGSDNCEAAYVGGWHIMVRKGTFAAGDLAVYFEIDSHLDTTKPEFAFLEKKHGNIKTQKYTFGGKGNFISQGLLMSFADFGWAPDAYKAGDYLTEKLGVTYSVQEDNKRKANTDKYTGMRARHPKIFKSKFGKWIMKYAWGRKIMYFFFGKKSDKKSDWPAWVIKTDEERAQNLPQLFPGDATEWIATEKIDGTSTTFTMLNNARKNLIVCSRNVVFDSPKKENNNYYKDTDGNVYTEMAAKYNMEEVLKRAIRYFEDAHEHVHFVTIQGETYGGSIQKRNYNLNEHKLAIFNVIIGFRDGHTERLNPIEMTDFLHKIQSDCGETLTAVPVLDQHFIIPATCDELLDLATGTSKIDGGMREGIVFRTYDGKRSFKAVSNEYLLKYHS